MPRLYKFAIFGFLAYAVVTATPAQQAEIGRGLLAMKNAAVEACTREESPCTLAIDYAVSTVSGAMSDKPAPWMDETQKRSSSISQSVTVQKPAHP